MKSIEFGDEGASLGTAIDVLQNGGLDFHEAGLFAIVCGSAWRILLRRRNVSTDFGMADEIEPPFAVAHAFVGKAAMFVRKGKKGFAEEGDRFDKEGQFAFLGAEEMSFDADDVAEVDFFFDEFERGELGGRGGLQPGCGRG